MAANYALEAALSIVFHAAGIVDSEGRAPLGADVSVQLSMSTGTGSSGSTADMLYVDRIDMTSGLSATTIDLASLSQAGNSQNMARPKYVLLQWLEGDGTAFFDRGATNGYTGWPSDGISVSKQRPIAVVPCTISTSGSDKNIDYSETGSATVSVRVVILGSSA